MKDGSESAFWCSRPRTAVSEIVRFLLITVVLTIRKASSNETIHIVEFKCGREREILNLLGMNQFMAKNEERFGVAKICLALKVHALAA